MPHVALDQYLETATHPFGLHLRMQGPQQEMAKLPLTKRLIDQLWDDAGKWLKFGPKKLHNICEIIFSQHESLLRNSDFITLKVSTNYEAKGFATVKEGLEYAKEDLIDILKSDFTEVKDRLNELANDIEAKFGSKRADRLRQAVRDNHDTHFERLKKIMIENLNIRIGSYASSIYMPGDHFAVNAPLYMVYRNKEGHFVISQKEIEEIRINVGMKEGYEIRLKPVHKSDEVCDSEHIYFDTGNRYVFEDANRDYFNLYFISQNREKFIAYLTKSLGVDPGNILDCISEIQLPRLPYRTSPHPN